jgi:hypothetical protein
MAMPWALACVCWLCRVISERLEEQSVNEQDASKKASVQGSYEGDAAQFEGASDQKTRLLTLDGIDRRTAAYRETKQLIAEIQADLGGADNLSAAERQMVQHGAVLGAFASDMEAKYLQGRNIDVVALCTLLNAQRRCFDAIGYKRRQHDVTPTLLGFLNNLEGKAE